MQPYSFDEPAKKSRIGLFLGLGALAVVILALAGSCMFFLFSGGDSPTNVTNAYYSAAKNGSLTQSQSLVCRADQAANRTGFPRARTQFTDHQLSWKVRNE